MGAFSKRPASAWIWRDTSTTEDDIAAKIITPGVWQGYSFFLPSSGSGQCSSGSGCLSLGINSDSSAGNCIGAHTSVNSVPNGRWVHVAGIYNGNSSWSGISLYIDGIYISTTQNPSCNSVSATILHNNPLLIGEDVVGEADYFDGKIDDLRIYKRELSASEVYKIYKSGQAKISAPNEKGLVGYWSFNEGTSTFVGDFSGKGNKGSFGSPIPTWTTGKFGKGLNFGATTEVNIPDSPLFDLTGDLTLTAWIKGTDNDSLWQTIVGRMDAANLDWDYALFASNSSNGRPGCYYGGGSTHQLNADPGYDVKNNEWTFLVCSWDGSNRMIYIDGVLRGSDSNTTGVSNSSYPLQVGDVGAPGTGYTGFIDEVRIYNRALSTAEVYNLYKSR